MCSSAQFWFIHALLVSTGKFLFQRLEERTTSDSLSLSPLVLGMKRFLISLRGTRTTIHDWSFHGYHAYIHFPSFLEQFLLHLLQQVISFISFLFISFMIWSFLAQHPSQFSLKTVQLLQQVQLSVVSHNPHPPA